jgi:hypothetical protein
MSHFTVLCIGKDPEGQLEPFNERTEVDEYQTGIVPDIDIASFRSHYTSVNLEDERNSFTEKTVEENLKLTFEELYDKYGDDWNGKSWKETPDGKLGEFSTFNPDGKWDWFQLGGRWSGFLKLKKGVKGTKGEPGLFGTKSTKRGWCDQALKKDIDFDGMRDAAGKEGEKHYKMVLKTFGGTIPTLDVTWDELIDETNHEYNKLSIEQKREMYHSQPAMEEVKKHSDKLGWGFELKPYQSPIEDYVKRCRENAIGTFAVLVEDNWYEKGEMGWFGITHNENPNWSSEFQKLLDSVDDDTLISLYDCHC